MENQAIETCLPESIPFENNKGERKEPFQEKNNEFSLKNPEKNNKPILDDKIQNFEEIKKAISQIEFISNNSSEYLKCSLNEFTNKNSLFLKEINLCKDKFVSEEQIQLMKRIYDIYSQIFSSIKQNLEIISRFLDKFINISKNIDKDKPIQDFLLEEFNNIIDCWLFLKIDFDKFDFIKALNKCNLDQNFTNFITKILEKKNFNLK